MSPSRFVKSDYSIGQYVDQLITCLRNAAQQEHIEQTRQWCRAALHSGLHPATVEAISCLAKTVIELEQQDPLR